MFGHFVAYQVLLFIADVCKGASECAGIIAEVCKGAVKCAGIIILLHSRCCCCIADVCKCAFECAGIIICCTVGAVVALLMSANVLLNVRA